MSEGFIYVASRLKLFYELALYSAESLKDFNPHSNVTLFTHAAWVDERAEKLFDLIITDIPVHKRAKMWCMARTPYDRTFYNDVDSQVVRSGLSKAFSEIDDYDMMFTNGTWHATASHKFAFIDKNYTIKPTYHGAVCCYKKTDLTVDFMQTWFDEYHKQNTSPDWPYEDFADRSWKGFDMFTLWRMTSGRYDEFDRFNQLKIKLGPKKYNSTIHDGPESVRKPFVLQIDKDSIQRKMPNLYKMLKKGIDDERDLPEKPKTTKNLIWHN